MNNKIIIAISTIITIGSFFLGTCMVGFIYLYFFDGNPPAVYALPYRTTQSAYKRGDPMALKVRICKKKAYSSTTTPVLVKLMDGESYPSVTGKMSFLPTVNSSGLGVGCGNYTVTGFFSIPIDLEPGRYYLSGTTIFHVNFIRDRYITWYTNPFFITQ